MNKPNELLIKFIDQLKPGSVIDLGSGDGTNVSYLTEKGFEVDWVEKNYGSLIEDEVETESDIIYDNIISFWTIRFLDSKAPDVYNWMKEKTESGGLNIVADFTDQSTWDKSKGFWLKRKELKNTYKGWKILHYEEKLTPTYSGSNQMAAFLVARKP